MKRRVVLTGLGMVTPLGNNVGSTWEALIAGRSGVGKITKFNPEEYAPLLHGKREMFPVQIAAELKDFDPREHIESRDRRRTGTFTHYALAASSEALRDSGLEITEANAERVGVYVGNAFSDLSQIELSFRSLLDGQKGAHSVSPSLLLVATPHMAAMWVATKTGAKGPTSATVTACSAGANAVGDSFKIVQRGDADAMICGGAESPISPLSLASFAKMGLLYDGDLAPEKASRPFDKKRAGFVTGEGAGIIILEGMDHARERGACIYAEVTGYGLTADATTPPIRPDETGSGAARAMRLAMEDAGVRPEEIGYVNAYGSSTQPTDKVETKAIKEAFGSHARSLAISSTKSMTGHLLGASGAVEAIFSVLAMRDGVLPPTINQDEPDPDCDLDYVPNIARRAGVGHVLSNSFGIGGANTSLVFKRYEE